MPRRTGFASPPSSLPRDRRVPSTTSRFRRSWPTRRRSGATRRRGSERSGRTSTPWRRSTSRRGRAGSRRRGARGITAGVTARERMAAAGYDVTQGDTWALNELTTAVRRGDGNARANVREFLRGLYEGDGARPTRGAVLVVGFGQRTSDLTAYQNTLQNWLADSAFWTDMATYVSDWSQEVYGDLRAHAVPGEPVAVRREYLNDYLQHPLVLANAGPPAIEAARSFLQAAYSPLANGAWPRETAWGWTMVPVDQMCGVHLRPGRRDALLHATRGRRSDHWGFAWAPRNTTGMSGRRLRDADRPAPRSTRGRDPRLGRSDRPRELRDGRVRASRPGHALPRRHPGREPQRGLAVVPHLDPAAARDRADHQSVTAGTPSAASTVPLTSTAGTPVSSGPALTVTLRSSSPSGTFATSPAGPWTTTLTLSVAPRRSGHLLLPRHARRCVHGHGVRNRRHRRHADRHRHGRLGRSRHDRVRTRSASPRERLAPSRRPSGRLRKRCELDDHLERRSARTRQDHREGQHGDVHRGAQFGSRDGDRSGRTDDRGASTRAASSPHACASGYRRQGRPDREYWLSSPRSTARAGRCRRPGSGSSPRVGRRVSAGGTTGPAGKAASAVTGRLLRSRSLAPGRRGSLGRTRCACPRVPLISGASLPHNEYARSRTGHARSGRYTQALPSDSTADQRSDVPASRKARDSFSISRAITSRWISFVPS